MLLELLTGGHSDGSDPALTHLDSAVSKIASLLNKVVYALHAYIREKSYHL